MVSNPVKADMGAAIMAIWPRVDIPLHFNCGIIRIRRIPFLHKENSIRRFLAIYLKLDF